jgi:hypothetical protein
MSSYKSVRSFFRALLTIDGQWDAKEGRENLSRACIYLAPIELTTQIHWDAHSRGFLIIGDPYRFRWAQTSAVNYPGLLTSRHLWISKEKANTIAK